MLTAVVELLAKRVWYRGLAGIRKMCSGGVFPKTRATHRHTRLPQEIVDMIVAYLIYDLRSLRVCSLTCYSLYIAAVPHLHHTLTVGINPYVCSVYAHPPRYHPSQWSNRIQHVNKLNLLPFVKKLCICGIFIHYSRGFYPEVASCSLLHKFSALSNVRELAIEHLDISNFTQRPQKLFRHFLPTVQFLALITPKGSHRQIIYFIGLFQHLEDLKLSQRYPDTKLKQEYSVDDLTLIPHFAPPLRGRLTMLFSNKMELVGDMISLFGGLRFRSMDLFRVDGMQLLLGACAETLESLRLYLDEFDSKQL